MGTRARVYIAHRNAVLFEILSSGGPRNRYIVTLKAPTLAEAHCITSYIMVFFFSTRRFGFHAGTPSQIGGMQGEMRNPFVFDPRWIPARGLQQAHLFSALQPFEIAAGSSQGRVFLGCKGDPLGRKDGANDFHAFSLEKKYVVSSRRLSCNVAHFFHLECFPSSIQTI